jgi:hypothetical protein
VLPTAPLLIREPFRVEIKAHRSQIAPSFQAVFLHNQFLPSRRYGLKRLLFASSLGDESDVSEDGYKI